MIKIAGFAVEHFTPQTRLEREQISNRKRIFVYLATGVLGITNIVSWIRTDPTPFTEKFHILAMSMGSATLIVVATVALCMMIRKLTWLILIVGIANAIGIGVWILHTSLKYSSGFTLTDLPLMVVVFGIWALIYPFLGSLLAWRITKLSTTPTSLSRRA